MYDERSYKKNKYSQQVVLEQMIGEPNISQLHVEVLEREKQRIYILHLEPLPGIKITYITAKTAD